MKSKRQETVLIVEDDAGLSLGLTKMLRSEGYRVRVAKTGPEGVAMDSAEPPDLVLLDVMLPKMNGFEVCEALRRRDPDLPIVFLSAKGEEEDRVRGLRLGGDDYIVKPFGVAELLARIDAALRRRRLDVAEPVTIGRLVVDFGTHTATCDGAAVEMTVLEMKLLAYLVRHEGSTISGPTAPWTISSRASGRRSSPTRKSPYTSRRCGAVGIASNRHRTRWQNGDTAIERP